MDDPAVLSYFETVERWHQLTETIRHLQAEERALREGLFAGAFPNPKEGTNNLEFPDGRILRGTYKITRKPNDEVLKGLVKDKKLPPGVLDQIIKRKPELILSKYRALDDTTRKVVDQGLEIKPGLPSLDLIYPKEDNA